MKNLAKKAVLRSGVLRIAAGFGGPGAAILMYHSVMENPASQENLLGGIIHSESEFRGQMELLARDYRPVSLDEIREFARGTRKLSRRAVAITFDDGYADNFEVAAPVLERVGIPASFYVTVDCLDEKRLPWPARLRFAFRASKETGWHDSSGKTWPLDDVEGREAAFLAACDACCVLTGEPQEQYVSRVERDLDARVTDESGTLMMSYEQLRKLARKGHIIGSHTMTHPNLAHVSLPELRVELTESKRRLERELESSIRHFSYPCPALPPNWTDTTAEESRKAGYETAVTTTHGAVRKNDDPLLWKRIAPTKTVEGLRWNLERVFAVRS